MSRFVYGDTLNHELIQLVNKAQTNLSLISPFIKLHPRLIDELKAKENKEQLSVIIIFGKNEGDAQKSFPYDNLLIFKSLFPNLEIRYEKRLHAKYYANEETSILTSMNLYDYSVKNNIEFGVVCEKGLIIENKLDTEAYLYFDTKVRENAELIYKQVLEIEKSFGGLKKVTKGIQIIEDNLEKYYNVGSAKNSASQKKSLHYGYCIRTGEPINFDPSQPLSLPAFNSWKKYENEDYPESFCHFSGEQSFGETTFAKPIMRKNWPKAKKIL